MDSELAQPHVVLVNMPWGPVAEPALGLSMLKSALTAENIKASVLYLNTDLLRYLKYETYCDVADIVGVNDFVFSGVLDDRKLSKERFEGLAPAILNCISDKSKCGELVQKSLEIRNRVIPEYIDQCVENILRLSPKIVGFTCSFDQTMAALACAKKLKDRSPHTYVVFGGYALHGETGKHINDCFDCVDEVVQGDGEGEIVRISKYLGESRINPASKLHDKNKALTKNIVFKNKHHEVEENTASLDSLNFPDFDDYFFDIQKLYSESGVRINSRFLPIESSRGCWWGQISHCVFCGIDDETMKYRYRSPEVVLTMLDSLYEKYGLSQFRLNDYILPNQYHKTLIPNLIQKPRKYEIACEIKANIDEGKFRNLSAAGFNELQPGIESFSSNVLKHMKKGVSASQNILTLAFGKKYKIKILYNILFDIPGEKVSDYEFMCKIIPSLYHLDPPQTVGPALFTRFSPLRDGLVESVSRSNIPSEEYSVIFSNEFIKERKFQMEKYCYYFKSTYDTPDDLAVWHKLLISQCDHWTKIQSQRQVVLRYDISSDECIEFSDSRFSEEEIKYIFGRIHRQLYLSLLERGKNEVNLQKQIDVSEAELDEAISDLESHRFIARLDNRYVALAYEEKNNNYTVSNTSKLINQRKGEFA